jgi:alkylated DNA repair protein (DNA oxidative demethylase)
VIEIAPGAFHLPGYLALEEQLAFAREALALGEGAAGFYTPIVRGGHPMSVRMLCLGRHWNALTYRYEDVRTDIDGHAPPPLPDAWVARASAMAAAAGFAVTPDLCIVNWYLAHSRMGLHQDKDESRASIDAGAPVISFSIGETGRFLFGGLKRKDTPQVIFLESGDGFVFGGPARLRYHGVTRIVPGSAPPGMPFEGRLNFTFRKF